MSNLPLFSLSHFPMLSPLQYGWGRVNWLPCQRMMLMQMLRNHS